MRSIREKLFSTFPSVVEKELSDEYIKEYPDLMWDVPSVPLLRAVPLYMLWCIDNSSQEGELVFDYTISALNTYAREKSTDPEGFKFACNILQSQTVLQFLEWCQTDLGQDYDPSLSRAIKNWRAVNKFKNENASKAGTDAA